ncbi:MAG: beta-galactosidase [Acidobacteria bacterium]|nr:beta-galactosidase [Acidobacteriota bacterium]
MSKSAPQLLLIALLCAVHAFAQIGGATWATRVPRNFAEPAWWDEGVVFVGNWEPLVFRLRHGGELAVNVEALYQREHTEETVLKLKQAGVNMVLTHFYKTGLDSEREDVVLARQLGQLLHKHGMKMGTYIGATMFAETLLRDIPESKDWVCYDESGSPVRYAEQTYRFRPDFNHPGYVEHMKRVIRVAIQDLKTDLIHFDNHALNAPPRTCDTPEVNRRFREFLNRKYTAQERKSRFGFADISAVRVPSWREIARPSTISPVIDPVMQEWVDFRCQDFAEYYGKLADYIRQLNPNVVVELNPHGIFGANRAFLNGVDHARLLPHGSVFWSEEPNEAEVLPNGALVSKIRSFKLARTLDQTLFSYTGPQRASGALRSHRLLAAEAMAFNRNCFGDIGSPLIVDDFPKDLAAYIRFYHQHNRHYRAMQTVADVALLRSFPSLAYNSGSPHLHTTLLEQLLIQYKIPFDIIFDPNLADLSKYRALVLGDQETLSDRAVDQIRQFVKNGGGLVATGRTSVYNDWRRLRDVGPFPATAPGPLTRPQTFGTGRFVYVRDVVPAQPIPGLNAPDSPLHASGFVHDYWRVPRNSEELIQAIRYANGRPFAAEFKGAPLTTVMELLEKKDGTETVLHFLNYRIQPRAPAVDVTLRIPPGKHVKGVELLSPDNNTAGAVKFTEAAGRLQFTIPQTEVYHVAVIHY